MTEAVYYIVLCPCDVNIPIAYLDDERDTGGILKVHSPSSQKILGLVVGGPDDPGVRAVPQEFVNPLLVKENVSEVFWGDGHAMWVIRCQICNAQVQMHRDNIWSTAGHLAVARDSFPIIFTPDTDHPERHFVPLGVLKGMENTFNG